MNAVISTSSGDAGILAMMSGGPGAAAVSIPAAQDPAGFLSVVNLLLASPSDGGEPVADSVPSGDVIGRVASPSQIADALIRSMWRAASAESLPLSATATPGPGNSEPVEFVPDSAMSDPVAQGIRLPAASDSAPASDLSVQLDGGIASLEERQTQSRKRKSSAADTAPPQTLAANLPVIGGIASATADTPTSGIPMTSSLAPAPAAARNASSIVPASISVSKSGANGLGSPSPGSDFAKRAGDPSPLLSVAEPVPSLEADVAFRAKLTEKQTAPGVSTAVQTLETEGRPHSLPRIALSTQGWPVQGSANRENRDAGEGQRADITNHSFADARSLQEEFTGENSNGDSLGDNGQGQAGASTDDGAAVAGGMPFVADPAGTFPSLLADRDAGGLQGNQSLSADAAAEPAGPLHSQTPQTKSAGIAVRVTRPDAHPVDVQIRQRAGEIHVVVRTPDTGVQRSLRDGLPELVESLDRAGFRTDTLTAADPQQALAQIAASSADGAAGKSQDTSSRDEAERNFQGAPQQEGRSSGGDSRNARDRFAWNWLEQMEE